MTEKIYNTLDEFLTITVGFVVFMFIFPFFMMHKFYNYLRVLK